MSESLKATVEIYRARNLVEAETIRLLLEADGIPTTIGNRALQSVLGEVPLGWKAAPCLIVNQQEEQAARAILEEFLSRERNRNTILEDSPLHCLACGAEMGNEATCAGCGWTYDHETDIVLH